MWDEKEFLQGLIGLMKINTVYDPATICKNAPSGKHVAEGLQYIRKAALADGFEVLEYDGHAIAIVYGDQSNRVEAVSHVDVVPAGNGWGFPPYGAVIRDNRLYGRGAQDMKTALWLSFTALKMIRAQGTKLRRQIRIVVGTAEERSMQDIVHYLDKAGLPDFAFTPDGSFPLCLGEKGDVVWYVDGPVNSRVRTLRAGQAANVICDRCSITVDPVEEEKVLKVLKDSSGAYEMESGSPTVFHILGKAAHTSRPELGDNAITRALKAIHAAFGEAWAGQLLKAFADPYGAGLGLLRDYPPMGYASVGLNILLVQDGLLHGETDVRFPAPLNAGELTEAAQRVIPGFSVKNVYEEPVFLQNPDNPFVRSLLKNYRKFCPDDLSAPYISGGVTYAKVYSGRCVAYGPRLPADPDPSLAHQADEYVTLSSMEKLCHLYEGALVALSNCEG